MMWEKVRLENLCTIVRGSSPRPQGDARYYGGNIPRLMIEDLTRDGKYVTPQVDSLTEEGAKLSRPMKKGDLVITVSGRTGVPAILAVDACIHDGFVGFRDLLDKINIDYLFHCLSSLTAITSQQAVGAIFKNLTTDQLKNLEIPLPPLPIQKRIAEVLDTADALRRKDEALLKKYDELAQAIFIDMFGDPVKNEKGWEVKKLGEVTSLITDGKHGNCNDENTSGYYFISAKDIFDEKIHYSNARQIPRNEFEEVDRRTNLQSGDIVMVNTGATIGKLAIAKDIPETRKTTFQKSVAVIKLKPEFINNYFLKYVFLLRINSFANKGTGSAVQNLLLSEMREFRIILPKTNLQNSFTEKIKNLEEQKSILQSSLYKKNKLFNSLLQKAFNGELVS